MSSSRRAPAPGPLVLVQQFLNTADVEAGTDVFATGRGARGWLRSHGLTAADESLDGTGRERLVVFREALRDVVDARDEEGSGGRRLRPALSELAQAAGDARFTVAFSDAGDPHLVPAGSGIDRVLGRLLAAIVAATADGTWDRLKICRNDACRWSFYDSSRNRSGHWCSMAICGNRMKGRAFRMRRSGPAERPPLVQESGRGTRTVPARVAGGT